tara:strand:- start:1063 stop:2220 length:1158 start_codon:yes stop_codon:yes gene_type:complete
MKSTKAVVDLSIEKRFTQKHLELMNQLTSPEKNPLIKLTEPHLYGDGLPSGITWVRREIKEIGHIKWDFSSKTSQKVRLVGNPKYKNISADIHNYGWKLKHCPPALFAMPDGTYEPADGRTRIDILTKLDVKNCVFDIYESDGPLPRGIFGLKANSQHDPAGDLLQEDVVSYLIGALEDGTIDRSLPEDQLQTILTDAVDDACGSGKFNNRQRLIMVDRIMTSFDKKTGIRYWTTKEAPVEWLINNNYIETDDIVFMAASSETKAKGLIRAADLHAETGKQVRVVVHTGILTGVNPATCFVDRCERFLKEWNSNLENLGKGFYHGAKRDKKTIQLYGFLPAVKALHPDHYGEDGFWGKIIYPDQIRPSGYKTPDEITSDRIFPDG